MNKYMVKVSINAEHDLENIVENISILNENLTGHQNIRRINVKNYIIFYIVDKD